MQRARLLPVSLLIVIVLGLNACAGVGRMMGKQPRRLLWVECQNRNHTLDTPEKVDQLIADAKSWGVDGLLVQVYRSGYAWYDSEVTDRAPTLAEGYDPLAYVIERASAEGIEVHAWINVFYLAGNPQARIVRELGQDVIIRDNFGRPITSYEDSRPPALLDEGGKPLPVSEGGEVLVGTSGVWLDPGVPEVRTFQLQIVDELALGYPGLSGIHLDFIRYPYAVPVRPVSRLGVGVDFGYAPGALEAFEEQTGGTAPLANQNLRDASRWDQWRREQIGDFVSRARDLTQAKKLVLSVAALAWADRAYLSAFQDWRGWLERDLIDAAVLMNYSTDDALALHITRAGVAAAAASKRGQAWTGLGAWLFSSRPERLQRQMNDAQRAKSDVVVLFSYDRIIESAALREFLRRQ